VHSDVISHGMDGTTEIQRKGRFTLQANSVNIYVTVGIII